MKRLFLMSAFFAATAFYTAGCSTMANGRPGATPSATTREQCRQQSALIGTSSMRRDDTTARRDIDCATLMPN